VVGRITAFLGRVAVGCRRRAVLCVGLILIAFVVPACGSSTSDSTSLSSPEPGLLKESEISRFAQGTVERNFLDYWSSLQFGSWADVAAYYDPEFRDYVSTTRIIGAKKVNSSVYPLLKPRIVRVDQRGDDTTIFYSLLLPEGTKELESITWRKPGGTWQIIYDSRLDGEFAQQASTQIEIKNQTDSTTEDVSQSPEAVRAASAASQIQARFLEDVLSKED
jgi:hypothetical protein